MKKRVIIKYKKKKISVVADNCNLLKKFIGLMFSRRENAKVLLFGFKKRQKISIHSFFVFYPFIAAWLDKKNKVVDLKIVRPFIPIVYPKKPSFSLIEIPINKNYRKIVEFLTK